MDGKIRRHFRIFGLWAVRREQAWLESMAAQGWQLRAVWPFVYEFEQAVSRGNRYFIDLRLKGRNGLDEYLATFADAGWRNVASVGIWQYFVSAPDNPHAEVYSDNRSQYEGYRRILLAHVIILVTLGNSLTILGRRAVGKGDLAIEALLALAFVLFLLLLWSTLKLIAIVSRGKREIRE
jgi:hypothetical protein